MGILSRERIALLPPDAIVVNVGRGTAVDQDALMEALNAGRIAGAALDVMVPEPLPADHPLWEMKNLLLTTHISGNMSLGLTCDLDVELFCEDLENYAAGRPSSVWWTASAAIKRPFSRETPRKAHHPRKFINYACDSWEKGI